LKRRRIPVWKILLAVDQDNKDYKALRDKVLSKSDQDRTFEDDGELYKTQTLK
jgi:hypothetical protein